MFLMMNYPRLHTESKCKRIQHKINQAVLDTVILIKSDILLLVYVAIFSSNS